MLSRISFFLLIFLVDNAFGGCGICQSNFVACHSDVTFSLCVDGNPTDSVVGCPVDTVCTDREEICAPKSDDSVSPSCITGCGICDSYKKVFACVSQTEFAFCFGEAEPFYQSGGSCLDGYVCDLSSRKICVKDTDSKPSCNDLVTPSESTTDSTGNGEFTTPDDSFTTEAGGGSGTDDTSATDPSGGDSTSTTQDPSATDATGSDTSSTIPVSSTTDPPGGDSPSTTQDPSATDPSGGDTSSTTPVSSSTDPPGGDSTSTTQDPSATDPPGGDTSSTTPDSSTTGPPGGDSTSTTQDPSTTDPPSTTPVSSTTDPPVGDTSTSFTIPDTTDTEPTTTTVETTTRAPRDAPTFCTETASTGTYKAEGDETCTKYYICTTSNGSFRGYEFTCPTGKYFNDETAACQNELPNSCAAASSTTDTPVDDTSTFNTIPDTTETEPTTTTVETTTRAPRDASTFCTETASTGTYKAEGDETCTKYYICTTSNGSFRGYSYTCPTGTYFNAETAACQNTLPNNC